MVRGRERAVETGREFFADLVDQGIEISTAKTLWGGAVFFYVAVCLLFPFCTFRFFFLTSTSLYFVSDICHCHNSIGCRPRHALGPHPIPPRDSHPHPFRGYLRLDRTRLRVERRGHYASSHRNLHRHLRGCGILPAGRVQVSFLKSFAKIFCLTM